MDRTIKQESGFTLIELLIVLAVLAVLIAVTTSRYDHLKTVNAINEDIHKISAFIHAQKLRAFTRKEVVQVTVAGNAITTIIDPAGANTAGPTLTLNNILRATGSPFSISSRGNITTGNISMNAVNTGAQYSCVQLDNIRTRLGVWDGANCTPL